MVCTNPSAFQQPPLPQRLKPDFLERIYGTPEGVP
jgi:hypothetical protein